jgi:hypothetical protein
MCFALTHRCGTSGTGGTTIITASFSYSGGWYYWNAGWWYPAWGYAPNAYYAYDGPIYAYNDLPPDQVVANVQAALQSRVTIRAKSMVCLDRLPVRDSLITSGTTDCMRQLQLIARRWNPWEWPNEQFNDAVKLRVF